jgi:hypothetical protein
VAKYPNPSEKELADAKAVVAPMVGGIDGTNSIIGRSPVFMAATLAGFVTLFLAIVSIVCAIAFRSGLAMRIFGVVAVKRDGSRAGRLRVFWRALVTWSPYVLGFIGLVALGAWWFGEPAGGENVVGVAGGLALGLFAALAVVSALIPERGLQDRLAGTWLVPR